MIQSPTVRTGLMWLALVVMFYVQSHLANALFGPDYAVGRHFAMAVLATAVTVPLVVLARHYLDREPFAALGLARDPSALRPLMLGALAWLLPFAVGLAICLASGLVAITPLVPLHDIIAFVPLLIVLVFLLEALPEELAFRGYIQANLGKVLPLWAAIAVQAILFGSWGVILWFLLSGGIDPLQGSLFYVMGAILGMLRAITGSVWAAIGFHLAFQTVAQLLMQGERGHFAIEGIFWLQFLALGALPFSLAVPIIERFYREPVAWRQSTA